MASESIQLTGCDRTMGDKAAAREAMIRTGVPVVPGSGVLQDDQDAFDAARRIGYPLIIKAAAGGGGKGMRVVHTEEELLSSAKLAQTEAASASGTRASTWSSTVRSRGTWRSR